jgi:hypothetical protein
MHTNRIQAINNTGQNWQQSMIKQNVGALPVTNKARANRWHVADSENTPVVGQALKCLLGPSG